MKFKKNPKEKKEFFERNENWRMGNTNIFYFVYKIGRVFNIKGVIEFDYG